MKYTLLLFLTIALFFVYSCNKNEEDESEPPVSNVDPLADINNTYGFGVLQKISGIWNGPVTSSTPLGGYPEWIVDFRPNSENQISAKNELDTLNDIFMSFFIAKYNNQYRVAFRNGGSFGGQKRTAYFLADSVSETSTQSFYRFKEIIKGKQRAYTDVIFKSDSLYIKSYTNKYNSLSTAVIHMEWSAKLQDNSSAQSAISNFNFPKKTLTKDFSTVFSGQTEAIYYSTGGGDPYPETAQPYLGQATVNYTFSTSYIPDPSKKVTLIITTQPLFNGAIFNPANLKFRSRYVILDADDTSFTFNYMHPGTYFIYALYDNDGNNSFNSGDWISTANTTFNLGDQGVLGTTTQINFTIP